MNNEVFMDCLAKQGIEVIDRKDNNGYTYEYIGVYSLDNFYKTTPSDCDRDMTLACRDYLDQIGIRNDPDADALGCTASGKA